MKTYTYIVTDKHDGREFKGEIRGKHINEVRQELKDWYAIELDTTASELKIVIRVKKEEETTLFDEEFVALENEVEEAAAVEHEEEVVAVENDVDVDGFENGHAFEDFKKGDIVYIFHRERQVDKKELVECVIVNLERGKNANGEDKIRNIRMKMPNGCHFSVSASQIATDIFTKKGEPKVETPTLEPLSQVAESEVVYIEKAMSPKNPIVKEYLAQGYEFVGKVWNGERNMYIAELRKAN